MKMSKLQFSTVQMDNGEIFEGKEIGELVGIIINKFSEAGLSYDKAKIVLSETKRVMGECTTINKITNVL